ncbi:type IV secretion protein Rhs [Actinoplanes italicus]|uniref:Phage baseplate assembly protein V n=1 Tax=Actinoplanes italicus TaxID=113567 RepID=A0A2T0K378_9ACTN|nr:phage baseplate assembly protein V [Actinoplanes italicus]PRX17285.1 phage baseplate assembly protein V [Actinoplanes italicus]GIE35157.1 type IV secretion protein Rhs [Actinoplanes italicus]
MSDFPDVYAPAAAITVGGRPLPPEVAGRVLRISVTQRLNPPDDFTIEFYDPSLTDDTATGPVTEGDEVTVALGYVGRTRRLISGKVSAVTAEFGDGAAPTLRVEGFDALHELTRGTVYRVFPGETAGTGQPDSDIVKVIAQELDLRTTAESVETTLPLARPRVQRHVTNLEFLEALAAANGFRIWVEDRTLHFRRDRPAGSTIELAWGKTLESFSPRLSIAGVVESVEVRGWNPAQRQSFSARATRSAGRRLSTGGRREVGRGAGRKSELVVVHAPVSSADEARTLAEQILRDQSENLVTGSGTSVGHPDVRVGSPLRLTGLGRFSGTYTPSLVTHTLGSGGYRVSFEVNGTTAAPAPAPAARHPGLLCGIVTANKDDGRQGRVRLTIPGLDEGTEHWARVATLTAGDDSGSLFLPEVGDEVLVAFEDGDAGSPVVVGALWNGRARQPAENEAVRLLRSRSGHEIRLDDTEDAELIEIAGAGGAGRLTVDAAGGTVTIESSGDIELLARDGAIRLAAKSVEVTADDTASLHGVSGLDLTSDAGLTINGSTVDIN